MKSDSTPIEIYLPVLSDTAVIEVREFLHNLSRFFTPLPRINSASLQMETKL